MRRFGEAVQAGQTYRKRPGAYAIIPRHGALLLTHQSQPEPEFQLPGGGIDPGESPYQALRREVVEETGWAIGRLLRLGAYRRFTYMPEYELWAEKIAHIYLAEPVRPRGGALETGHTAHWVPATLAVEILASSGDRAFVDAWLR